MIIPTYARPDLLVQSVESVLAQTVHDFECLVVDDASPAPVVVPEDPRVRLIRRVTNGGTAAARNTGLAEARGRFVVFLDDDDSFLPRRLEAVLPALERAPVVVCWLRADDGRSRGRRLEGDVAGRLLAGYIPNVCATTVWRARVPPFDESFRTGEDVEWWVRLAQDNEVTTVAEPLAVMRRHRGPRHDKSASARAVARVELIERHAALLEANPAAAAFQWRRVARYAAAAGDRRLALRAHLRAFRAAPSPASVKRSGRALFRLLRRNRSE